MQFKGRVIHGKKYGRTLGYPTINIDPADFLHQGLDATGVYAGRVTVEDTKTQYKAGMVIFRNQSENEPSIEAHLVDFSGDLYGKMVTFEIVQYIRPFQTYTSEEELKSAIAQDMEIVKNLDRNTK